MYGYYSDDELMHFRTKGSKNGVRLYQNPDGSLTELGRIHYGIGERREWRRTKREIAVANKRDARANYKRMSDEELIKRINRLSNEKRYVELVTNRNDAQKQNFGRKLVQQFAMNTVNALPRLVQTYADYRLQQEKNEGKGDDKNKNKNKNKK